MREKRPITNSNLKPVDTKNPQELRRSLREASNLSRLTGGKGHSDEDIERIIQLHCEENLTLESSVSKVMDERSGGRLTTLRKMAEQKLKTGV
jgi:hypothetical protein